MMDASTTVKKLHARLREDFKAGQKDLSALWKEHLSDRASLQHYATAMHTLATGSWSKYDIPGESGGRIKWCIDTCDEYFLRGKLQNLFLKDLRRVEHNMSTVLDAKLLAVLPDEVDKEFVGRRLHLLDVGSCYNPFENYPQFEVTAVDIAPAVEGVWECDFTNVRIVDWNAPLPQGWSQATCALASGVKKCQSSMDEQLESLSEQSDSRTVCDANVESSLTAESGLAISTRVVGSAMTPESQLSESKVPHAERSATALSGFEVLHSTKAHRESTSNCKECIHGAYSQLHSQPKVCGMSHQRMRHLEELRGEWYDVVVFCLLLSYFPATVQRLQCCVNAHKVLRPHGLLLIITPDSTHQNKHAKMMKDWKVCIEGLGFHRWRYTKEIHLHCMAFRKVRVMSDYECFSSTHHLLAIPQDRQDPTEEESGTKQNEECVHNNSSCVLDAELPFSGVLEV